MDFKTTPLSTDPPDFSDCTDKWSSESDWLLLLNPITSISSVNWRKGRVEIIKSIIEGEYIEKNDWSLFLNVQCSTAKYYFNRDASCLLNLSIVKFWLKMHTESFRRLLTLAARKLRLSAQLFYELLREISIKNCQSVKEALRLGERMGWNWGWRRWKRNRNFLIWIFRRFKSLRKWKKEEEEEEEKSLWHGTAKI